MKRTHFGFLAATAALMLITTPFATAPADNQARVIRQAEALPSRAAPAPSRVPASQTQGEMDRKAWLRIRRTQRASTFHKNRRPGERAHRTWRLKRSSGKRAA